ncbi:MAG TPA: sigma-70 family RNA polymerase sigma factor [Gemmatimonadales bacterium]|nr:sigma-70 family RNA polymerase sigma factor [Gemmatimonadales bacterium]
MDKEPDEALAERCRRGERSALEAIVRRYQKPLYNAAFRVLGNHEDASETTQTVFLRVWERIHDYDPQYRFFGWIYRIAMNESLDVLRRTRREEPIGDDEEHLPAGDLADPAKQLDGARLARRVQAALDRMKGEDRVVLTLRHFSECSYREIAGILGIEEKTVKSRLFEARQRLRALLEPTDGKGS